MVAQAEEIITGRLRPMLRLRLGNGEHGEGVLPPRQRREHPHLASRRWEEVTPHHTSEEAGEQVWQRAENLFRKSPQSVGTIHKMRRSI